MTEQERVDRGKQRKKRILAVRRNSPPRAATVVFGDNTADVGTLSRLLRRKVEDITPDGELALFHKAVQIDRDITQCTSGKTVRNIIRAVLSAMPQFHRVGIICHRKHVRAIESLESEFENRITKIAYFHSGEERSSNDWYEECDLIVIVGTPRVSPTVIQQRLIQIGEFDAAGEEPQWDDFRWQGTTESGEKKIVEGRGYRNAKWWEAHRERVRAELVQAVGRGRGILPDGCPVILLSNEECGLPLSDIVLEPMSTSEAAVLRCLTEITAANPNRYILENTAVKSAEIASRAGLSERQTRDLLVSLKSRGLLRRIGQRKGWLPVDSSAIADTEGIDGEPTEQTDTER